MSLTLKMLHNYLETDTQLSKPRATEESILEESKVDEKVSKFVCDNPPTELEVKLYMLGYVNEKELGLTEEDVRMIHLNFINHYGEEGTNWTYMAGGTKKTKLQRWHSKANKFLLNAKGKKK